MEDTRGHKKVDGQLEGEARRQFTRALLADLRALERMIDEDAFETGVARIGAEQELFLVDEAFHPAAGAMKILERIDDPHFTTELGLFNLEVNADPQPLAGDGLARMEAQMLGLLDKLRDVAAEVDMMPVLVGILPTIRKNDLGLENMVPSPRYRALNQAMTEARGAAYDFAIRGTDDLVVQHDSVMVEACNASFQVHLQVDPKDFARLYNLAQALAAPLPIRVIVDILGVPKEDADYMVELSDHLVSGGEDLSPNAYGNTTPLELLPFNSPAAFGLFEYGRKLGDERRADPHDDLVTTLIQAEVDGDHLSDTEYANMFQVLVFAGNETTRTAISNGINAFIENPDQLELLHANPELVEQAVEEIIRFATPVLHMRRTATKDTRLAGVEISKGDKVVIWYASANFDETVFENPLNFDISRPVRPKMVSFGAQGPHNCLGAPLARLEIRILLEEIVRRGVRFTATGSIVRTRSNFVNGVASLPARLVTPA